MPSFLEYTITGSSAPTSHTETGGPSCDPDLSFWRVCVAMSSIRDRYYTSRVTRPDSTGGDGSGFNRRRTRDKKARQVDVTDVEFVTGFPRRVAWVYTNAALGCHGGAFNRLIGRQVVRLLLSRKDLFSARWGTWMSPSWMPGNELLTEDCRPVCLPRQGYTMGDTACR